MNRILILIIIATIIIACAPTTIDTEVVVDADEYQLEYLFTYDGINEVFIFRDGPVKCYLVDGYHEISISCVND